MRIAALAAALAVALTAAPTFAQDAEAAPPSAEAAESDEDISISLDLDAAAEAEIDGLAEDFSIVMQTMAARTLTVRMDPVLTEEEKATQAAAIQAEYQPQIDEFTAAISGIVSQQTLAGGGSAEDAAAQGDLIGGIVAAAVRLSTMTEPDPALIAEIEAAAAQLEAMESEDGEADAPEVGEE